MVEALVTFDTDSDIHFREENFIGSTPKLIILICKAIHLF